MCVCMCAIVHVSLAIGRCTCRSLSVSSLIVVLVLAFSILLCDIQSCIEVISIRICQLKSQFFHSFPTFSFLTTSSISNLPFQCSIPSFQKLVSRCCFNYKHPHLLDSAAAAPAHPSVRWRYKWHQSPSAGHRGTLSCS